MATTLYVLNPDNTIHWQNYKLYLRCIKERFANNFNVNTKRQLQGYMYGFTLSDPYSVAEVNAVLQSKNITLPTSLLMYLTNVSKEMFVTGYPFTFNLHGLPSKDDTKKIFIPYEKRYNLTHNDFYYADESDEEEQNKTQDITNKFEENDFNACMCRIAEHGCAFNDSIYLGSGPLYGSVWRYNDDNDWTKVADTFDDYIRIKFCKVTAKPM